MTQRIVYDDVANEYLQVENGVDGFLNSPLVSFDDAILPMVKHIENLDIAVHRAKQNWNKTSSRLNADECQAIYLYTIEMQTDSVYTIINRYLRANDTFPARPWFPYMKLLYTALEKLPSHVGSVWRGVNRDIRVNYKRGAIISWWAFTSCTAKLAVIKDFLADKGKSTIFMIECLNGKNISKYSSISREDEILLQPGIKLEVVDNALDLSGLRIVHLREIATKSRAMTAHKQTSSKTAAVSTDKHKIQKEIANQCSSNKAAVPKAIHTERTKTSCPHCSTKIDLSPEYKEGTQLVCHSCKKTFIELTCVHCNELNSWKHPHRREGEVRTCWNCKKQFQYLNCPHCTAPYIWKRANYVQGQKVSCWNCRKQYQHLNCPNCSHANFSTAADYTEGQKIGCAACKKPFQHINCPHCTKENFWKNADRVVGVKTPCFHCGKSFQVVNCPHCQKPNHWRQLDYKQGLTVTCCNCRKKFQHINCPHCLTAAYFSNTDNEQSRLFACRSCQHRLHHVICPDCNSQNFLQSTSLLGLAFVTCAHCSSSFLNTF
ncbi:unnamed protein product [Adineta ricciae]|uniref:NAD(P)(+)--arginine ADP-ribosyltransferase n=1 Tax=Adineta ricciae TaxID=249248 RepID=A0A815MGT1_ADIRI|nr:unnamed protein product [Adineta ricciae]